MPLRCAGAAGVQEKIPPHCCGGIFESAIEESALGELGSPTGGLEAVLSRPSKPAIHCAAMDCGF